MNPNRVPCPVALAEWRIEASLARMTHDHSADGFSASLGKRNPLAQLRRSFPTQHPKPYCTTMVYVHPLDGLGNFGVVRDRERMRTQPIPSLQLQASELLRTPLAHLTLDELKVHATAARMLVLALVQARVAPGFMSQGARVDLIHLAKLLEVHLAAVYELIEDRQVEAAWAEQQAAARLAGASRPGRGAKP